LQDTDYTVQELMAIAGPPSGKSQPQARQAAPEASQGPANSNLTAQNLFGALVQQESRGRAGAVGPDTQYGNALGRSQMLPATAREMAGRVGVPFDERLLRGTSPEASAYQDRLGMAYLQEGFERTGNPRDALMYYHGGPDRRLWGPKTRAYAAAVLERQRNGDVAQISNGGGQSGTAPMSQQADADFSVDELMQMAGAPDEAPQSQEFVNGRRVQIDVSDPVQTNAAGAFDLSQPTPGMDLSFLTRGDQVALADGQTRTLRGAPFADNSRGTDQNVGGFNLRLPNATDTAGAFASAATEQVPFADEAATGLTAMLNGRSYSDERGRLLDQRDRLNQTDRGARVAGGLTGFATSMAIPGGAFIGRGGNIANRALRGAGIGAGVGAVYGAGAAEGGAGERATGAGVGAALGGVGGAAAPVVGAVAGSVGRFARRTAGQGIDALLERPQNAQVVQREALSTLRRSMADEGITEAAANRIANEWSQSGVTANLIDLLPRGGQTQRLLRGASARSGPAGNLAENYLDQVSRRTQDNAINLTNRLTPDQRPVAAVDEALRDGRSAQAEIDYRGPYREQVAVGDDIVSALADEPGRAALRRARSAAVARRSYDQVAEIDALLAGEAQSASAGTIDRARIAMAGRGRNLTMGASARPDIAGGLFDRANDLDGALDALPAIQPARETYRRFSEGIEGLEIGAGVRGADPDFLASQLAGRPGSQYTAPIGAARALATAIGRPTDGSTGLLNVISGSPNMRRNLPEVFGQESAQQYQDGIGNLVSQLNNARFQASSAGSKTAGVLADLVEPLSIPQGPMAMMLVAIDKIRRGVQMTPDEAAALVQMAQQPAARGLFTGSPNRRVSGYAVPTTSAQLGSQYAQ